MLKIVEETLPEGAQKSKMRIGRPFLYILGWLASAAIAVAKIHFSNPAIADDAYITLRYSYNLLHHGVFTFNYPAVHAAGAETSPLYGLILTPLLHYFSPVRCFDIVMGVSVASSAVLLFELIHREWGVLTGLMASIAFLLNDYLYATRGMETALFIFACLATILVLHSLARDLLTTHKRPTPLKSFAGGLLLAIATFIRGEGILLLLFPAIELVIGMFVNYRSAKIADRTRRLEPHPLIEPKVRLIRTTFETAGKPFKMFFSFVAGAALVSLPLVLFLRIETGHIIPATLQAKEAQARSGFWGKGWIYYTGLENFIKTQQWRFEIYTLAVLAFLGLLVLIFSKTNLRTSPLTLTLLGFGVLQLIAYGSVLIVPFYHWYFGPQILAVSTLAGIATGKGLLALKKSTLRKALALPAIALFAYFAYTSITIVGVPGTPLNQRSYTQAAAWLDANTPRNATVAASEVGYLGYYSHRQMIGYLGLLDPKTIIWLKQGNLFSWIYYYKPDYWIVHQPTWAFEQATQLPWFPNSYTAVASFPGLTIYKRINPAPASP